MSAGPATGEDGERTPSEGGERTAPENSEERYLVSPTATGKKRHRPDETGDEPACRAFLQRDDAEWRRLSARQTVFYDDCTNCFPRE
ncbi:hypothetical protein M0R89_07895 [Halorussus limi]|uniref:Uncharacterized protein n=1 Tax=Halorussus limi TaxID=2938695 RepID=A0A8U0HY01_9EURY|nr:hypothetical protein [Halorussus limi]UPV75970.1 hypothetical protein M0R89_07895 [Halorussus limi]